MLRRPAVPSFVEALRMRCVLRPDVAGLRTCLTFGTLKTCSLVNKLMDLSDPVVLNQIFETVKKYYGNEQLVTKHVLERCDLYTSRDGELFAKWRVYMTGAGWFPE